jgi:hypothetical protein
MLALAVFHEAKKPTYLFLYSPLSLSLSVTTLLAKGTSIDIENDRAKGQAINCPERNKVRAVCDGICDRNNISKHGNRENRRYVFVISSKERFVLIFKRVSNEQAGIIFLAYIPRFIIYPARKSRCAPRIW